MLNPTQQFIVRIALVLPVFTSLFTLFASIILRFTSSHEDLLQEARHELTRARTGVHTNKISTIDRDNNLKEGLGTGLRRSPMLVSEKSSHGSPGHATGTGTAGSTVDSPETRNSCDRSLAENSPLAP